MKIKATQDHFDWSVYRARRDALLKSSDRYMLVDFPISEEDRQLLMNYRAELRALFENVSNPQDLVFPEWPLQAG